MTPIASCGCKIESDLNQLDWSRRIFFCPLHAAAQEMLELIKRLVRTSPDEISRGMAQQLITIHNPHQRRDDFLKGGRHE